METWAKGHEELCAERYKGLQSSIGELKSGQSLFTRIGIGVLIAIIGWLVAQLYNDIHADESLRQAAHEAAVQAVTASGKQAAPQSPQ